MTDDLSGAHDLFEEMRTHVESWSQARRGRAGLDLIGADRTEARRLHARSVLIAQDLLEAMARDHPGIVLMKGLEVAQLYPSPLQRPFRDVDVLLHDPQPAWEQLVSRGFRASPRRRIDLPGHHHLPALVSPHGLVGVEIHQRPNAPAWAGLPTDLVIGTAQPSRTGIEGLLRPRDDLHALLMALHCWKSGFSRVRDLFDALALDAVADVPVTATAKQLDLSRFWAWTQRLGETEVLGRRPTAATSVGRRLLPRSGTRGECTRARLIAPYLIKGPVRVTRSHLGDLRLGRAARAGRPRRGGGPGRDQPT